MINFLKKKLNGFVQSRARLSAADLDKLPTLKKCCFSFATRNLSSHLEQCLASSLKIPGFLARNQGCAFEQNRQQNCQFCARAHIEVTKGIRLTKLSAFYSAGDACCNF